MKNSASMNVKGIYRIDEIASVLAATKDKDLIEQFLRALLTGSEIEEISSRWEIVKLLKDGMSQRKISDQLGVSLCKITRGSRELRDDDSAMDRMIEKFNKSRDAS